MHQAANLFYHWTACHMGVGGTVVTDLFFLHERGKRMGIFSKFQIISIVRGS